MNATNGDIAELLARAAGEEKDDQRRRALRRASHAAFHWTVEAADLVARGEKLTVLPRVGPWIAGEIERLVAEASDGVTPPAIRQGFLTRTQVVHALEERPLAVRCDLQLHSTWSDGHSTLDAMVVAARDAGYEYMLITDHSKGLPIANGMDEDRLRSQWTAIDAAAAAASMRVLRGIEMNIDPHGEGDMEPDALAGLDVVLGAFHSALRLKDDQTERYLAALRNPWVDVLAHPRGRMYNARVGLTADWPRVFAEARALDKAVEVDGYPARQDIDVALLHIAAESGVRISLGSDSHHVVDLDYLVFARGAAAMAGIPEERIINCMPADELIAWAAQHRT
ncbi:MAG: hypothetical protein JOZ46_08330 [Candidatus Dormibacteraeota bacterium]|nr:hypothetical protein [Candidatus Dormibacteraeota bacterium]MBV9525804.1 hypothetical protein [Candidatus Dormibacteraeota bacterium]